MLHDQSLEFAVVGTMMQDARYFTELEDGAFYSSLAQSIYKKMKEYMTTKGFYDETLIVAELENLGFDEKLTLEIISTNLISEVAFPTYISKLIDMQQARKIQKLVLNTQSNVANEQPLSVLSALMSQAQELWMDLSSKDSEFGIKSIDNITREKTEFLNKNWLPIPMGMVTIIAGAGGVGKSMISMQTAIRALNHIDKAFLWLSEDAESETSERFSDICDLLGKSRKEVSAQIDFSSAMPFPIVRKTANGVIPTEEWEKFKVAMEDYELIVLDPLKSFGHGVDENSNDDMDVLVKQIVGFAKETGKAVVVIHHASKTGGTRGASAIQNAVRLVYTLNRVNTQTVYARATKDNINVSKYMSGSDGVNITINKDKTMEVVQQAEESEQKGW